MSSNEEQLKKEGYIRLHMLTPGPSYLAPGFRFTHLDDALRVIQPYVRIGQEAFVTVSQGKGETIFRAYVKKPA